MPTTLKEELISWTSDVEPETSRRRMRRTLKKASTGASEDALSSPGLAEESAPLTDKGVPANKVATGRRPSPRAFSRNGDRQLRPHLRRGGLSRSEETLVWRRRTHDERTA